MDGIKVNKELKTISVFNMKIKEWEIKELEDRLDDLFLDIYGLSKKGFDIEDIIPNGEDVVITIIE